MWDYTNLLTKIKYSHRLTQRKSKTTIKIMIKLLNTCIKLKHCRINKANIHTKYIVIVLTIDIGHVV